MLSCDRAAASSTPELGCGWAAASSALLRPAAACGRLRLLLLLDQGGDLAVLLGQGGLSASCTSWAFWLTRPPARR